jgi:hypothetical protein
MAILEGLYLGAVTEQAGPTHLVSLYWDACRAPALDETTVRHWERQLFRLDARSFLKMARATSDPAPWHPMLLLLNRYEKAGYNVRSCKDHILSVAQDLLNLQGLRKIRPQDMCGNQLRVKALLATISDRGGLHGTKE